MKVDLKMPKWLKPLDGENKGKFKIVGAHNEYIMEEQDGEVFESCKTLSGNSNGQISLERMLAMRSLISPKIPDNEFGKIKGGDYIKLQTAVAFIYGFDDFLQDEE